MRLSHRTNLAVRMLMYCAVDAGKLSTVTQVADAYSVSALHLFQVLKPIVDAGLIETVRGRAGGIRLARPADTISLADVVLATETTATPKLQLAEGDDVVDRAIQDAFDAFMEALGHYTIEDLVRGMPELRGLLRMA